MEAWMTARVPRYTAGVRVFILRSSALSRATTISVSAIERASKFTFLRSVSSPISGTMSLRSMFPLRACAMIQPYFDDGSRISYVEVFAS